MILLNYICINKCIFVCIVCMYVYMYVYMYVCTYDYIIDKGKVNLTCHQSSHIYK